VFYNPSGFASCNQACVRLRDERRRWRFGKEASEEKGCEAPQEEDGEKDGEKEGLFPQVRHEAQGRSAQDGSRQG
jgi:hypothetical protein